MEDPAAYSLTHRPARTRCPPRAGPREHAVACTTCCCSVSLMLSYGVVAAFDVNGRVPLHFRFTKDRRFEESLNKRSGEQLWWSRKRLPLPRTPDFPVARQVVDNKVVYQRVFDDFTFEFDV